MGTKKAALSYTALKEILEDLEGSRGDSMLTKRDLRLLDRIQDQLEDGGDISEEDVAKIEEVWMRLA